MGRPPLSVGTYGKIGFAVAVVPPQRVRARAHFRDFDGVVRQVTKFGASKAAAGRAAAHDIRNLQRATGAGQPCTPTSSAAELGAVR